MCASSLLRKRTGLWFIESSVLVPRSFGMGLMKHDFAGWDEGVLGMNLGESARLKVRFSLSPMYFLDDLHCAA